MYFTPIARQNQAEVLRRFQSLLKLLLLSEVLNALGPVLEIDFCATAESRNLKDFAIIFLGDLILGPKLFGPPKMSLVLLPW